MRKVVAGGGVRNVGGAIVSEDGEVCEHLRALGDGFLLEMAR